MEGNFRRRGVEPDQRLIVLSPTTAFPRMSVVVNQYSQRFMVLQIDFPFCVGSPKFLLLKEMVEPILTAERLQCLRKERGEAVDFTMMSISALNTPTRRIQGGGCSHTCPRIRGARSVPQPDWIRSSSPVCGSDRPPRRQRASLQ